MSDKHEHGHGHDDQHGHGHGSPFIQHHYDDAQHQFDSGKLAIWFFLVQEVLFFSALFVAYILYRHHRPEIFAYAHHYLDVKWGAINTGVLIVSSLSAAWAVRCAQLAQRKGLIACLAITILCACGFLGIKYVEYSHKIHEGILFGKYFDPCISSGGQHLLTRKDQCPGTKRSQCRPVAGLDHDAAAPGWQVACSLEEVTGTTTYTYEDKVEKDPATGAEKKVRERKETFTESGRRVLEPCAMASHGHGPAHAANPPCWEIAQNPWVCKANEAAALVHYGDHKVRSSGSTKIELKCTDAPAQTAADLTADTPLAGPQSKLGQPTFGEYGDKSAHDVSVEQSMGPPPPGTNMFFSVYFAMTGLHGLHVLFGIFVFIWLLIRAIKGHFTPEYFGPVDYAALYWHLVDLIWIFLFPLLYLIH